MARIRSIHPGLFTDEAFMTLSSDAQVFFLGLLTEADDQGVFEWKPLTLKVRLRGGKDGSVDALLEEIMAVNSIQKYELGGRQYGAVRNFRKYQRPKKPNSIHPITPEIRTYVALSRRGTEPNDDEGGDGGNEFGTGGEKSPQMEEGGGRRKEKDGGSNKKKEPSGVAKRATPPADLSPVFIRIPTNRFETEGEEAPITEKFVLQFESLYPAVNVRDELRKACAWAVANKAERKTTSGMHRFVNSWLARQQNRGGSNGNNRDRKPNAHENHRAGWAAVLGGTDGGSEGVQRPDQLALDAPENGKRG